MLFKNNKARKKLGNFFKNDGKPGKIRELLQLGNFIESNERPEKSLGISLKTESQKKGKGISLKMTRNQTKRREFP